MSSLTTNRAKAALKEHYKSTPEPTVEERERMAKVKKKKAKKNDYTDEIFELAREPISTHGGN